MSAVLTYRDVSKSYRDGGRSLLVLSDLSFDVPESTLFAISGRSGVGKSTVLNLAAGFDEIDEGEIAFHSEVISDASPARREALRREEIGFVFQRSHLIPELTALENITLSLHDSSLSSRQKRDIAADLLVELSLSDRADHLPEQLSGGQRQRVAVARAIAGMKALLLADEPTSSLDDENRDHMISLFRGLIEKRRLTIVVASHDAKVLAASDRVLSLDANV